MIHQSLPGIRSIGFVPAENLPREIMLKHLAGIPVGIFADITPISFIGVPTCEAASSYSKNGRVEQVTLRFRTLDELPVYRHIAFVLTDSNGQSYVIGQHERPRPIVKISQVTGTPDGEPAGCSVEVILYAQKALIPCIRTNGL